MFLIIDNVVHQPSKAYRSRDATLGNIQQLYALPTLYLCVLYLSENKHRILYLSLRASQVYNI